MAKLTLQDKQDRRAKILERISAAMPSVMQQYSSLDWKEELKGYRTDYEYYPDYIHAPIHGVTDGYTNPQHCLAWVAAMDAIIQFNFEYEFAKAGFTELDYVRYAVGLWYMVGRKLK
jgi:hypothetical protein